MLFSSIPFLYYFLPGVLITYFLVPQKLKNAVLLLFSLVFYGWGEPKLVFLMVFTIALFYFCGLAIGRAGKQQWKKFWLFVSVAVSLGLLGIFKYADFLIGSVNAVTGSNGDFYKFRSYGFVTYYGKVYRSDSWLDTCFVDDKGDLLMVPRLTFRNVEEAQAFVDANNVRFSLAFGPILVKDGRLAVPDAYACGEIEGNYTRAAIAQLGQLHYMLCVTSYEGPTLGMPTSRAFARELIAKGCISAYALDGGQTAMLITNDQVVNRINFDQERTVSDIIYFATAVPSGG